MLSWSPKNVYVKEGSQRGVPTEDLVRAHNHAQWLSSHGLPPILTLNHLANETKVPYDSLRHFVRATPFNSREFYKSFEMSKRNGGDRFIQVPSAKLKALQQWVSEYILSEVEPHPSSYAFHPNASIYHCAREHCLSRWLIKLDIENFFESIKENSVFRVFRELGYPSLLSFELARLTTSRKPTPPGKNRQVLKRQCKRLYSISQYDFDFLGYLAQGAPSSPMLSNLVCYELDKELSELADEYGLTYTRYADDITFSAGHTEFTRAKALEVKHSTESILNRHYFKGNDDKFLISPPGSRKLVLGLVVNSEKPTLRKEFKDEISLHLHYSNKFGPKEHALRVRNFESIKGFRNFLKGKIEFAIQIQPDLGLSYLKSFSKIDWPG